MSDFTKVFVDKMSTGKAVGGDQKYVFFFVGTRTSGSSVTRLAKNGFHLDDWLTQILVKLVSLLGPPYFS